MAGLFSCGCFRAFSSEVVATVRVKKTRQTKVEARFVTGLQGGYFATRSLESEVPIELNTVKVWLAVVTRKNLSAPLAHYCSTLEVGSPGEPVLTCTV